MDQNRYNSGTGSIGIGAASPTTARLVVKGTTTDTTASALNITDSANASLLYVNVMDGHIGIGTATDNDTYII